MVCRQGEADLRKAAEDSLDAEVEKVRATEQVRPPPSHPAAPRVLSVFVCFFERCCPLWQEH